MGVRRGEMDGVSVVDGCLEAALPGFTPFEERGVAVEAASIFRQQPLAELDENNCR